jgi:RNA polymerase sigma factor (sigma-70 family)
LNESDASDEALMTAYVRGEREAFAVLFGRLAPRLHAFFTRSFADGGTADDLLQVTFLQIHRSRAKYHSGLPLRPWIFSIAERVRIDELRRRYRRPEMVSDEELDDTAEPLAPGRQDDAAQDLAAQVQRALGSLPPSQRVVIHLHRFEGMTFPEIAIALGATEGAIKLRAFRAYERLRTLLEPIGARVEVKTA